MRTRHTVGLFQDMRAQFLRMKVSRVGTATGALCVLLQRKDGVSLYSDEAQRWDFLPVDSLPLGRLLI